MHDLVIRNGKIVDGTGAAPRMADIAIDGDKISAVGSDVGEGRREIDATGHLVTPGWVDVHTHYDGQVTWDPYLSPSSWHGVTTVVMGNCGVGFAPVRPGEEAFLIELMEGVEDIPGTALAEGICWGWESFPEYLDVVEGIDRAIDVAAQVPHCAIRAYVLGDRAHDLDVTQEEIEEMRRITLEGLEAGAVGFTTSRTVLHRSIHGLVPGTWSKPEELVGIGEALGEAGHGVFEMVADSMGQDPDISWMRDLSTKTGRPVTFALAQNPMQPAAWKTTLEAMPEINATGAQIIPQVPCRPTGMLFGLQSSAHSFLFQPTYKAIAELPLDERVAEMRKPELREKILSEKPELDNPMAAAIMMNWPGIYPLGDPPEYEPAPDQSAAAVAEREGRRPEEVVYDWMLEQEGRNFLFVPLANYVDANFDALREMLTSESTMIGLSDGGAHCGLICDCSMPTYLLTHWARDRSRGEGIPVEQVVKKQTSDTAKVYGFEDRGVLAPGMKADVNVIDFDGLHLHAPKMVFDLPAGGRRLIQKVDGYRATICSGEVIFENGEPTGALPGKLIRGPQPAPTASR
jgi:N-acyl-D-aspartate/D-glutamate deacylase